MAARESIKFTLKSRFICIWHNIDCEKRWRIAGAKQIERAAEETRKNTLTIEFVSGMN